MGFHTVFLSVGSNMGERRLNCEKGIAALTESGKTRLEKRSLFYKTEPLDYTDQDWFINCAVKIQTALEPFELLDEIQTIESSAGRKSCAIRFGPRILDLDIIFFDNIKINSSRLVIPHPRMHKRRFVLRPFCDIEPKLVHPVFKTDMGSLLKKIDENEQKVYPV